MFLFPSFDFSSSLPQNKLHLYGEEKRILYLHFWLSTEQKQPSEVFVLNKL